jgi:DNA polymerase-3 subunit delta'
MRFIEIPGHNELKRKLVQMCDQNRIGHALTFIGESGSANLALALAFAQYINCSNKGESDSCGECPSCVKHQKLIHPDVHMYYPVNKSKEVKKDPSSKNYQTQWREFVLEHPYGELTQWIEKADFSSNNVLLSVKESQEIIKDISLKSFESEYRFAIIWLPELLHTSAANKLLKIIEEPPQKVFFFLISENVENVISTILSRTQMIRIGRPEPAEIIESMKNEHSLSEDQLKAGINAADGNLNRLQEILKSEVSEESFTESFISWARLCYEAPKKMPQLIDMVEEINSLSKENQREFLNYSLRFFRASLLSNSKVDELAHPDENEISHLKKFAPLIKAENGSALIEVFNRAIYSLDRFANTRILFLNLSLEFARHLNPKNVHL